MGKNKPRINVLKSQNNFGGEGSCANYDKKLNICHNEYGYNDGGISETIMWQKRDKDGILVCKGNRHQCYKQKLKWLASLSEKEKEAMKKWNTK